MDKKKVYICCNNSKYEFMGYQHTTTSNDIKIYIEVHRCITCDTFVRSLGYFFEDKPSEEYKPPQDNILL